MRKGKAERAVMRLERIKHAEAMARASLVPATPGRYSSMCGVVMGTGNRHFNHTGWVSDNARRIGRGN